MDLKVNMKQDETSEKTVLIRQIATKQEGLVMSAEIISKQICTFFFEIMCRMFFYIYIYENV